MGMLTDVIDVVREPVERQTPTAAMAITTIESITMPALRELVVASFAPIRTHMTVLASKFSNVAYDVTTPRGMADAKAARNELREAGRYPLQRLLDRLKREANDLKGDLTTLSDELIAITYGVEDTLHKQITAEEERREAERKAKAEAEAARVAKHEAALAAMGQWIERCKQPDMTAARIAAGIAMLTGMEIGASWDEFQDRAAQRKAGVLLEMQGLRMAAQAREEQAAEAARLAAQLAAEREVMDAQRRMIEQAQASIASAKARIAEIRAQIELHEASTATELREAIAQAEDMEISEATFGDFLEVAELARERTLAALRELLRTATEASVAFRAAMDKDDQGDLKLDETPPAAAPAPPPPAQDDLTLPAPAPSKAQVLDSATPVFNVTGLAKRLGFALPSAFVAESLGIPPVRLSGTAVAWPETQWPAIKQALIDWIAGRQ